MNKISKLMPFCSINVHQSPNNKLSLPFLYQLKTLLCHFVYCLAMNSHVISMLKS